MSGKDELAAEITRLREACTEFENAYVGEREKRVTAEVAWLTQFGCTRTAEDALAAMTARAEAAKVLVLREAVDAWSDEGHDVMFNRAGDNLSPERRVGKWLTDRADELDPS